LLPYPMPGYWAQSQVGQLPNISTLVIHDPPGNDHILLDPPIFWRCIGFGMCDGGPDFKCKPGYAGRLCSRCEPGHILWRGTCESRCEVLKAPALVNLLAIGAVITVWLGLNKLTAGSYAHLQPRPQPYPLP
jgi:hypothetical protein